jgi:hypothetical protein
MYRKGSSIAIVLVFALCIAGAASALPLDPEMAEAAGGAGLLGGLWDRFLDWVDQVAGGGGGNGGLIVLEMDTCHLDPNGACGGT